MLRLLYNPYEIPMERIIPRNDPEGNTVLISFKSFFYGFNPKQRASLLAASWAVGLAGVLAGAVTLANVVTATA